MEFVCCEQTTSSGNDELNCCVCNNNYHISCIFPDKADGWEPSNVLKSSWQCTKCMDASDDGKDETLTRPNTKKRVKKVEPSGSRVEDKQTSPIKSTKTRQTVSRKNAKKEDPDLLTADKVRSIIKEEFKEMMSTINVTLIDIKTEVESLKNSVKFISDKYDSVIKRIDNVENNNKIISVLEEDLCELKCQISTIQSDIQKQEQWGRRSNVEIVGLPEKSGENLLNIVSQLGTYANCPVNTDTDIDFVTRVAHRSKDDKKPKPIVVRFLARYKKDNFLARLRAIKDLKACDIGYSDSTSRIFCNEHLSISNKILLNKTKKIADEKNYKFVWVKNQSIMVRKTESSQAIHISSEGDLKKIV